MQELGYEGSGTGGGGGVLELAMIGELVLENEAPQIEQAAQEVAQTITEASKRMADARVLGKLGEKTANIIKNTKHIPSLSNTAKYRIPDALDKVEKTLIEIKNVKYQALTNQLKDFNQWAEEKGYSFILKTRENTTISSTLQEYIDKGKIIHKFIGD